MTEVLFDRFAPLADPTDDSDWLDVRRRARRYRRLVVPAAAAAAAVIATAAVAGGGWVFSTRDHHVTAATTVSLKGRTWRVSITSLRLGRLCFHVSGAPGPGRTTCNGGIGPLGRVRPFGAVPLDVPGGQIWVGAALGFARRIAITDATGRVHTTSAIAAPRGTKTPFRYWVIALAGEGRTITAYDGRGHTIRAALP
jgi:hypothetical protein